jgi:hypothetical protein
MCDKEVRDMGGYLIEQASRIGCRLYLNLDTFAVSMGLGREAESICHRPTVQGCKGRQAGWKPAAKSVAASNRLWPRRSIGARAAYYFKSSDDAR